jgi:two-component system NtrC family sensor kinase
MIKLLITSFSYELMKPLFLISILIFSAACVCAQQTYLDNLQLRLGNANRQDTNRVEALCNLADYYGFIQFDSCIFYTNQSAELSKKLNYTYGWNLTYLCIFHRFNTQGNYPMALQAALNYRRTAEELKDQRPELLSQAYYTMGLLNREMADYEEAKIQFINSIQWQQKIGQSMAEVYASYAQMGILYLSQKKLDSALWYARKGYELGAQSILYAKYYQLAIGALGNIHSALNNYKAAEGYFRDAIVKSRQYNNIYFEVRNYNNLSILFDKMNIRDSCIYYAGEALRLSLKHNFAELTLDASKMLSGKYEGSDKPDSSLKYIKIMLAAKDSVFSQSRGQQFRQMAFNEVLHQKDIDKAKEKYNYQVKSFAMLAALGIFLILAFMSYRNARQKQKAKTEIEKAFKELKATQSQLIQSEKMASLGELTAGIAHEIQNPLNFVNNFSDVSNELMDEMNEEIDQGNMKEAKAIASDIKKNLEKITHHGQRADAIVKSMLLHSHSSNGIKEPANINALADEYLRLTYQGMRAKEISFNATMKTDYDASIGLVPVISQDIGRVILNLITNAFYAVNEKKKSGLENYEPTVSLTTQRKNGYVEITVADNGNGIPQKVLDKIFQPFFTTKPTGEGTGLGLSLSYDIIKAHGGEIKVKTEEGSYTEFIIRLPVA